MTGASWPYHPAEGVTYGYDGRVWTYLDSRWVLTTAGPAGATGATGATGPTGATGATGATGPGNGLPIRVNTLYIPPRNLAIPDGAFAGTSANVIHLSLFDISTNCTLDRVRSFAYANAVLTGKNMKFLVYSVGANGFAADKIYESTAIALSNSSSVYQKTSVGVSLTAGQVWAGVVFDSTIPASNFFGCFVNATTARNGGYTSDPTDTQAGYWDGVAYTDSYSSPMTTALDTNVSRVRKQLTNAPVVWLALT